MGQHFCPTVFMTILFDPLSLPVSSVQCSSWLLGSWSTHLASTQLWSGPSAEMLTFTTLATVRSAGATCWPLLESCSPSSCPFLPNMRRRSSCPPPLYPHCYSSVSFFCPPSQPLSLNLGLVPCRDTCIFFFSF